MKGPLELGSTHWGEGLNKILRYLILGALFQAVATILLAVALILHVVLTR